MKLMKTVTALAAATVLAVVGVGTHTVSADSVSDAKSALSTKQSETSSLQQQLQAAQDAVAKLNEQASTKAIAITAAKADIADATKQVKSYDVKIAAAQQQVKARTKSMQKQLRSLQKEVGDSVTGNIYFDFILNADNVSDAVGRSFTVNKLNTANQEALAAVQAASTKLSDLKQAAAANQQKLIKSEAKLEADRDQLKSLAVEAGSKQAALQKKIAANQSAVNALQGDLTKANAQAKAAAVKATTKQAAKPTATVQSVAKTAGSAVAAPKATASATSGSLAGAIGVAERYIGVPYVWGGMSPSGFDCSGLVAYAAAAVGISLPRTSGAQSTLGSAVSLSALAPGDLLFWGGVGSAYHVALYIGGGRYIHAPTTGQTVTIQSIAAYGPSFARRL